MIKLNPRPMDEILTIVLDRVWDGKGQLTESRGVAICSTTTLLYRLGVLTKIERNLVCDLMSDRLGEYDSVATYLRCNYPEQRWTMERIQQYRRGWLKKLIKELSK